MTLTLTRTEDHWILTHAATPCFTGVESKLLDILGRRRSKAYSDFQIRYGAPLTPEDAASLQQSYNTLRLQPVEEIVEESIPETPLPPPMDLVSFLNLYVPIFHWDEYKTMMAFAASDKHVSNPPWLCTIAPPSNSKSFYYKSFNDPRISVFVDDMTEQSLAAGTASAEQEVNSLLDDADGLNLIMNDMSSIFSQRSERVRKWLGTLTTSFGGDYYKHSPGQGVVHHATNMTIMMAMTYQTYKKHIKYVSETGNRFFFLFMKRPPQTRYSTDTVFDYAAFQAQASSIVYDALQRPLPTIPQLVDDYLFSCVNKIVHLRSLMWAVNENGVEGDGRLYQQLQNLTKSLARLFERDEVTIADVDFFLPMIWNSVMFKDHIYTILQFTIDPKKGYLSTMIKHGLKLNIIEMDESEPVAVLHGFATPTYEPIKKYHFTDDYTQFVSKMLNMDVNRELVVGEEDQ